MVTAASVKVATLPVSPMAGQVPLEWRTSAAPATLGVPVAFIGDSYTGGSDMGGNESANWTSGVAAQIGATSPIVIRKAAISGIGYVSPGTVGKTFLDEVPAAVTPGARLVVVFGSRNDLGKPGDVGQAATRVYAAIRDIAPDAKLLVVGPPWINGDVPAGLVADRDAVKAAAVAAGATFVDPIADGWFSGANARLIGSDHVHPTDDGHAYMARLIAPHIQAALAG